MHERLCQVKMLDIIFFIYYYLQGLLIRRIMDHIVELGILYDFYGELLTDHQKEVYEELVYNNLSISEIAENYNISRQAASDLIKRCNKILLEYEDKLKLVKKFNSIKSKIEATDKLSIEEKSEILKEL